ncbi:MAG TPA: hypothetical protein VHE78_08385 [Gemmatimonadaceae bacterium]|nr:hypothetical protein [Gemmatimonadaceae bacterium]
MTMRGRYLLLLAVALVSACSNTTAPAPSSRATGSWVYGGTQQTPSSAALDGSVSWRSIASGVGAFEGTFTMIERKTSGEVRTLSGAAAGQLLSDSIADFDLLVQGIARRHIGILRADSISGSWASIEAGSSSTGRFVLRRSGP